MFVSKLLELGLLLRLMKFQCCFDWKKEKNGFSL